MSLVRPAGFLALCALLLAPPAFARTLDGPALLDAVRARLPELDR